MRSLFAALICSAAAVPPAQADGVPAMATGTPLSVAKGVRLAGNNTARLICSDAPETVFIDGKGDVRTLGYGEKEIVSCRWLIPAGTRWNEAEGRLADVTARIKFDFVPPAPGKEPQLYKLSGDGAPSDYAAAVKSLTASYGKPTTSGKIGPIVSTEWKTGKLEIWVRTGYSAKDDIAIEYSDSQLRPIADRLMFGR